MNRFKNFFFIPMIFFFSISFSFGDDYYGRESFKIVADYYRGGVDGFSMVAFQLDKTLSIFGGVTRGLCTVKGEKLDTVIETNNLQKTGKLASPPCTSVKSINQSPRSDNFDSERKNDQVQSQRKFQFEHEFQ